KEAYQLQEEDQEIFLNSKIVKDMDIIEITFDNEGGA
ncbi:ribonuclease Z, partial [Enterococcus faecalis]